MKFIKFIPFLFICGLSISQNNDYKKGEITDSVLVSGTTNESFQLYLPKAYNSEANSAIIYIFDPTGNGTNGIKPFIKAADKYNYILVCSNNSKNGPVNLNFEITNRLFEHIFSEFKTDPKQIYTAGFSGGSRLASVIAVTSKAIQGVIGCGAGFMSNKSEISKVNSFSYVGLVGNEDMNYQEMFRFKEWLSENSINNELFTYEDRHRWPPQNQILRALGWIELQAYKKRIRPYNKDVVTKLYNNNHQIADSLKNLDQTVLAVMEYERILRNYSKYFALDSIANKVNTLKATTNYNQEIKIREEITVREQKTSNFFTIRFNEEVMMGRSKDDYNWWRRELKIFDDNFKDSDDYFVVKMGKRLRYRFMAFAFESSNYYARNNSFDQRLYCDRVLVLLQPKKPYWYFRLAKSYAQKNDFKSTIYNLKKALELGYNNIQSIHNAEEFKKFKEKKRFNNFLISLNN